MLILFFIISFLLYTGEVEEKALEHFNNKKYDESLELALTSTEKEMLLLVAKIYEIKEDIQSIEYYKNYLEAIKYEDKELIFYAGNLAAKSFLYETAFKIFSNDEVLFKNVLATAIMARFIGKYKIAKEKYLKLILEDENNYEAVLGLAITYQMLSQWDKAIKYFKKSLTLKEDENVYVALAEIYMSLGKIEKAKTFVEKSLKKFESEYLREILVEIYSKLEKED